MNEKEKAEKPSMAVPALGGLLAGVLLLATSLWLLLAQQDSRRGELFKIHQRELSETRQAIVDEAIGFPAREEHLEDEAVYLAAASFVDVWPDYTNNFAVLVRMEMREGAFSALQKTNRLFRLLTYLDQGAFYRVKKIGAKASFEKVYGPVPLPLGRE